MTPASLWLLLALALLTLVLAGLDSDGLLLIGGVAGLLLALVAMPLGLAPALQILLWAVLVAVGYGLLRRWSRGQGERLIPPAAGADQAEVISPFDAEGVGRVRWQGQSWAAINLATDRQPVSGSRVTVLGREGTRLQVLPIPES